MPLSMVNAGEERTVIRISGKDETKHFLENLGFVEGANITVISEISGNLIVNVKETRVKIMTIEQITRPTIHLILLIVLALTIGLSFLFCMFVILS